MGVKKIRAKERRVKLRAPKEQQRGQEKQ